jgi:hypothetical protein
LEYVSQGAPPSLWGFVEAIERKANREDLM